MTVICAPPWKPLLTPVSDETLPKGTVTPEIAQAFPGTTLAAWQDAEQRLGGAGYGAAVPRAFRSASLSVAQHAGPGQAISLARSVSHIAIKAGPGVAAQYCPVAADVARKLADPDAFATWSAMMTDLAGTTPDVVRPLLDRTEQVLERLSLADLQAWVKTGLRLSGRDKVRRRAFFTLESEEAQQLLERQAGTAVFQDLERQLAAELRALFGVAPPFREFSTDTHGRLVQRSSFSGGVLQLPSRLATQTGQEREAYRAAVAHIGAHLVHGRGKFPLRQLKPMQVAVISLIEDARIELLAMRDMPGLARLWRPFHTAPEDGARTATSLFARLSRALIDPDFAPSDGWVCKGRGMFFAASEHWDDPGISRHIGNLLGNDLGQLRVQFNAKNYRTEPVYRDDNMGLWDFPDPEDARQTQALSIETQDLRRSDTGDHGDRTDTKPDDSANAVEKLRPEGAVPGSGQVLGSFAEYDYEARVERPDWVTVREYAPVVGDPLFWTRLRERHGPLIERTERMARAAAVGRSRRLKRQLEGERLDLPAAIEAAIDLRLGLLPDPRVQEGRTPPERSIAVHLLLDTSQSTADPVPGTGQSILDLERDAAALLCLALDKMGDPLEVSAFCSAGREDVRIVPVKRADEQIGVLSAMGFSGLRPGYSTRMGAALRYAGARLRSARYHRRLALMITDGEPSDVDCPDPSYLRADTRRAVQNLSADGIDCFCIALGSGAAARAAEIFGRQGHIQIDRIGSLPEKLSAMYMRLTR